MGEGDRLYKKYKGFKILRGDESNPTFGILVDDASEALHICDPDDQNTDWAVSAYSHPTLVVHSATTPETDYVAIDHDATDGTINIASGNLKLALSGTDELTLTATALTPSTDDDITLGTASLKFGDLFLGSAGVINFNNGDVTITHASNLLTIAGGGLTMGSSGTVAGDFILWPTVALGKVWLDVDGDTNGAFYFGADDVGIMTYWYGDTATYAAHWDPSGDTNGAWYFGANDWGVDVLFYGQTASNSMVWDASANALVFTAGSIQMGTSSGLLLPVKATGETTKGYVWYDTTDDYLHFYDNAAEVIITGCVNA